MPRYFERTTEFPAGEFDTYKTQSGRENEEPEPHLSWVCRKRYCQVGETCESLSCECGCHSGR